MVDSKTYYQSEMFEVDPSLFSYACFAAPLTALALSMEDESGFDSDTLRLNEMVKGNQTSKDFREVLIFATTNILTEKRCDVRDIGTERLQRKGEVISFDGINGAGKTTLIHALDMERYVIKREHALPNIAAEFLEGRFLPDAIRLKELSGISETLLLAANLYYQLVIQPVDGRNVIDRGTLSFFAYQTYVLMHEYGIDRESAQNYLKVLLGGIPHPDISYFLDVDLATVLQRIRINQNDLAAYEQIRTNFFNGLILIPNCRILDATGEPAELINNFRP